MRCPVCRAENAEEVTCRRCRADLALLVALERTRNNALSQAARAATAGDGLAAQRHAEAAHRLRPGVDSFRWLAIAALLRRDFSGALAYYPRTQSEA